MRAPFQVIVLPYRGKGDAVEVLIGKRADERYWQCVSGGGETGETPLMAAIRECQEESGLNGVDWLPLDSMCMLPKYHFAGNEHWETHPYVIPEYAFAVEVNRDPVLSPEHTDFRWCHQEAAIALLHYDSNKTAVWELYQRLHGYYSSQPQA